MSKSPSSSQQHRQMADEQHRVVKLAVVTVSDTRTPETDVNRAYLRSAILDAGHELAGYMIIKDEPDQVVEALDIMVETGAQVVMFNGGTGISKRDRTYDALSKKLEKTLPGFGEIFRMLSYEQVGAAAMLSRATAGVYRDTVIVSTPGSPKAVQLAWEKLVLPEMKHLAWEIGR